MPPAWKGGATPSDSGARMRKRGYIIALGASLAFGSAAAQTALPSQFTCAIVEAMDCEAGASCVRGGALQMGAPGLRTIVLKGKRINGPKRSTPIVTIEASAETPQIQLQGTEVDFGWTLAIDTKSGSMAGTLTNREGAFLL